MCISLLELCHKIWFHIYHLPIDIIHVILASLNLIFQCAFTFTDWEFMAEMNNSVYGNPSSLTIQNEKNIKTGEYSKRYIFSFYVISNVHHLNFVDYGIDSATSHFNEVTQSAVTRIYIIQRVTNAWDILFGKFSLDRNI